MLARPHQRTREPLTEAATWSTPPSLQDLGIPQGCEVYAMTQAAASRHTNQRSNHSQVDKVGVEAGQLPVYWAIQPVVAQITAQP